MKTRLWKKRFRLFVWYKFWKHNLKPGLCFLFMHRSGAEKDGSAGAISSIILSAPLTIRLVLPAVAFSLCSEISSRGAAHLRARPVQFVSEPRALSEQKFYCAYTHSRHSRAHVILFSICDTRWRYIWKKRCHLRARPERKPFKRYDTCPYCVFLLCRRYDAQHHSNAHRRN